MYPSISVRLGFYCFLLSFSVIVWASPTGIGYNYNASNVKLQKDKYNSSVLQELYNWLAGKSTDSSPMFNHILSSHSEINPTHMVVLHAGYGRTDYATHRILWIQSILATAYVILSLIGLFSNLLVVYILVFMRRRALSSITNIFVLVLAISDIFLCGFNMPLQAYYEIKEQVWLSPVACKMIFACFGIPMHVSCLTILLIACDRYQIIIYPLRPRMSVQLALVLVGLIVLLSVLNSIPIAMFNIVSYAVIPPKTKWVAIDSYVYRFTNSHSYCVENWPNAETRLIYSVLAFLVHFLIPLILTAALYGHIYCRLHERRFRKSSVERKRRTNKILIRIVICFALCWAPWTCFSLWLEVHAYMIQKKALELNRNLSSFETPLDNTDLTSSFEFKPTNWSEVVNQSLKVVDFDAIGPSGDPDEPSRAVLFKIYGVHSFGGSTKLIDLCLKLIAMASACINPWLYGWLRKLLHMFYQRSLKRLRKKLDLKSRIHDLVKSTTKILKESCMCRQNLENMDEFPEGRSTELPPSHERPRKSSRRTTIHVCNCCGALCTCQVSLGILKRIDHLNYVSQIRSYQSCADNSSTASPSKDSCNVRDTGAHNVEYAIKTKGFSRGSHSGSSRQKSSKNSNGATTGGTAGVDKPADAIANGIKPGTTCTDPFNSKSYGRGRRASSRLSGTSFGTMSYLDPSTKQTSLFPSSGVIPTPRSSFQHSTGPITMFPDRSASGPAETQKHGQGNLLSLPYTGLTPFIDTNKMGENPDSKEFEHSGCYDEFGLTINVPALPNDYKKVELFNLCEQSEESGSAKHSHSISMMPEFIQVSVHFPQPSKQTVFSEQNNTSGIHLVSCTQSPPSQLTFGKSELKSRINCLQIEFPLNCSAQIPFVDEVEDQDDNTNDTINFVTPTSDTYYQTTSSNMTNPSTPYQQLMNEPILQADNCFLPANIDCSTSKPEVFVLNNKTQNKMLPHDSGPEKTSQHYDTSVGLKDTIPNSPKQHDNENDSSVHINAFKRLVPKHRYLSFRRRTIERDGRNSKDSFRHLDIKNDSRRISHQESKSFQKQSDHKQMEDQKVCLEKTQSISEETSEIDEFAQISRLVAIELMRKRQARERTLSVCVPSNLPEQRLRHRLSTSHHVSEKKRLSFSFLPGIHIPKLSENRDRSPRILEFEEPLPDPTHCIIND